MLRQITRARVPLQRTAVRCLSTSSGYAMAAQHTHKHTHKFSRLDHTPSHLGRLKERLIELLPEQQAELKKFKAEHGAKIVDKVTVDQLIGGARSIKSMLWETSLLDPVEGIRFRGYSIPELQEKLPTNTGAPGEEPTPEGLFWLLMTGEVPTKAQADALTAELHARSELPSHVEDMIRTFPKGMHPMTQLSSAILAMQTESVFAAKYAEGTNKALYWDHTYEDVMNLIARLPKVAALIYRCSYHDGIVAPYDSSLDYSALKYALSILTALVPRGRYDSSLDYSANFCQMLGFKDEGFHELMRLYITIHSDHEGGNASAHTCHLVGSTLSDPYLSLSASMNALAGPLHGLANQEVLGWLLGLQVTPTIPTHPHASPRISAHAQASPRMPTHAHWLADLSLRRELHPFLRRRPSRNRARPSPPSRSLSSLGRRSRLARSCLASPPHTFSPLLTPSHTFSRLLAPSHAIILTFSRIITPFHRSSPATATLSCGRPTRVTRASATLPSSTSPRTSSSTSSTPCTR